MHPTCFPVEAAAETAAAWGPWVASAVGFACGGDVFHERIRWVRRAIDARVLPVGCRVMHVLCSGKAVTA